MILNEIFYAVKCDRCGDICNDGEHSFWNDESGAIETAYESGWTELKGNHYCHNCYEVNEETDEIKIYEDYPEYLKILIDFIDKVAKGINRNVLEYEGSFLIKTRFYKKAKLSDFEEEYIKKLIGSNFISLEYETDKYYAYTCLINIKK